MSMAATQISLKIWRTIVGSSIRIPAVNSYVYYFPQGHLENVSIDNYDGIHPPPLILCQLVALDFFCCPHSGEPFVKFRLQPIKSLRPNAGINELENENNEIGILTSSSKVLTPSDTNNNGIFSVLKCCAQAIFPPLNYSEDTPVQALYVKDACNIEWKFRHIYRGSPRRHLLTTEWIDFVTQKRLVARDSVVFIKRTPPKEEGVSEELFIGIWRKAGFAEFKGTDVGDMLERRALAAIGNAARKIVFEVDYYPMGGLFPAFVVSVDRVEASKSIPWEVGMRAKMSLHTHDSTPYKGRIVAVHSQISNQWPLSPWRKLQVSWDDPHTTPYMNYVSPWEVEREHPTSSASPHIVSAFPLNKKLKLNNGAGPSSSRLIESLANSTASSFPSVHYIPNPDRSSNDNQSRDNIAPPRDSNVTSFRLFGKDIQLGERDVSENPRLNSFPNNMTGFRNNRKGKNVANYDE